MTATNVILGLDAAHLVTDGAAIDSAGRLVHTVHKVTPLPHLNAAVAFRGARAVNSMALDAIAAGANSYDQLAATIDMLLREQFDQIAPVWKKQFGLHILDAEIVVAGWSESRGPHAYVMATTDKNKTFGLRAWRPIEIQGAFLAPSDNTLAADFAKLQIEFNDERVVELVHRQRTIGPMPGVGSFVQLTTVRKHGIESRILKRWPDAVGEVLK